jgi:hypothetical protein
MSMTEINKYVIAFLLVLVSCNKYDKVLTKFEEKLHKTDEVKKYFISNNNKYDIRDDYSEAILCDNKETKLSIINAKKETGVVVRNAYYELWDNRDKTDYSVYYYAPTIKKQGKKREYHDDIEAFLKDNKRDFEWSPWLFYISKNSAHKYDTSLLDNRYGYSWYIFSGKLHPREKDFPAFSVDSDNSILFEIWVRQDEDVWLEFYKNGKNEIKAAIEGTFKLTDDDRSITEPENLAEAQKTFYESFKNSFMYKMNILKDTELGRELYLNLIIK